MLYVRSRQLTARGLHTARQTKVCGLPTKLSDSMFSSFETFTKLGEINVQLSKDFKIFCRYISFSRSLQTLRKVCFVCCLFLKITANLRKLFSNLDEDLSYHIFLCETIFEKLTLPVQALLILFQPVACKRLANPAPRNLIENDLSTENFL